MSEYTPEQMRQRMHDGLLDPGMYPQLAEEMGLHGGPYCQHSREDFYGPDEAASVDSESGPHSQSPAEEAPARDPDDLADEIDAIFDPAQKTIEEARS